MSAALYGAFVFLVSFVTDIVWAHYTMSVADKHQAKATFYAVAITLTGLIGWDAYHRSYLYVLPFALGAAAGTYLTVRRAGRAGKESRAAA